MREMFIEEGGGVVRDDRIVGELFNPNNLRMHIAATVTIALSVLDPSLAARMLLPRWLLQ